MRKFFIALLCLTATTSSGFLSAATIFTNKATFLSNINSQFYNNDFDIPSSLEETPSRTYPLVPEQDPNPEPNNGYIYTVGDTGNQLYVEQSAIYTAVKTRDLIVTFNASQRPTAFGGEFAPTNLSTAPVAGVTTSFLVTLSDGSTENLSYISSFTGSPVPPFQNFIGYGFNQPISSIRILAPPQNTSNGDLFASIETLIVGAFQPVPEPSMLSSLGIFGLLAFRRRR